MNEKKSQPPCPAPKTCWLYLIRHGATENNRANPPRLQGRRTDPGLSGEGLQQAEWTGRFLADVPVNAVFSSPLLRARQTAEAIALPHGLAVQDVEELIEVDVGRWEGRPWDEIEQTDPEAYRAFMRDPVENPYLGGETVGSVSRRVIPAIDRLMVEHLGQHIVVVAHNVVNRSYLAHLLGLPLIRFRAISQDNCGVNLLRSRNGSIKPVTINGLFHLGCPDAR